MKWSGWSLSLYNEFPYLSCKCCYSSASDSSWLPNWSSNMSLFVLLMEFPNASRSLSPFWRPTVFSYLISYICSVSFCTSAFRVGITDLEPVRSRFAVSCSASGPEINCAPDCPTTNVGVLIGSIARFTPSVYVSTNDDSTMSFWLLVDYVSSSSTYSSFSSVLLESRTCF